MYCCVVGSIWSWMGDSFAVTSLCACIIGHNCCHPPCNGALTWFHSKQLALCFSLSWPRNLFAVNSSWNGCSFITLPRAKMFSLKCPIEHPGLCVMAHHSWGDYLPVALAGCVPMAYEWEPPVPARLADSGGQSCFNPQSLVISLGLA